MALVNNEFPEGVCSDSSSLGGTVGTVVGVGVGTILAKLVAMYSAVAAEWVSFHM